MLFGLLLIINFIGYNFAQSPDIGSCPTQLTVTSFDLSKYAGLWYENRRSVPNFFEVGGKCVTANYSLNDDGSIKVVNRQISWITGIPSEIVGIATKDNSQCGNSTGCGKLIVEFPIPVVGKVRGSYWILDTDYTSYSVVWSCSDLLIGHVKFLWLLTREPIPDTSVIQAAMKVFDRYGMDGIYTEDTDQKYCP